MKSYLTIGIALAAAAAAAGAATYVSEDFSGSFPPAGWYVWGSGYGSGDWIKTPGPYWGDCAEGYARAAIGSPGNAYRISLYTAEFVVAAAQTVYYRFDYRAVYGGTQGSVYCYFHLEGPGMYLTQIPLAEWRTYANSRSVVAGTYRCRFEVVAAGTQNQYGYFLVDNVLVADAPFTDIAPASLGRVKTLFH